MLTYCHKDRITVLDEVECVYCTVYKPCSFCGCHHDMTGGIMNIHWDYISLDPSIWIKIWYFNKKNFGIFLETENYYHEISTSKFVLFYKVYYLGVWRKDLKLKRRKKK